jgi:MFS family permease
VPSNILYLKIFREDIHERNSSLKLMMLALTQFFSGPGQTYSISVFLDSYIQDFNLSRSYVSSLYSIGTLFAGLSLGVMGGLFDRYGHRIMTTAVAICFGVACLGMSLISNGSLLLVGFFLIRLLGQGSMGLSSATLVPQWFMSKKGRALSLVTLGGVFSSALLPPFNTWLIQSYGWQFGWWVWAILLILVMSPLAMIFIRNTPEEFGLLPDNRKKTYDIDEIEFDNEVAWTLKEAIRTRSFWLIIFCSMVPAAISTGLVFHQVSVMNQIGLSPESAALVLSMMAIVRIPVVLIVGPLADKFASRYLLALTMGLLFVSLIILLIADSFLLASLYGLILGVRMGVQGVVLGVIWPDYYGRRNISSIRGVSKMAGTVGTSLGPFFFGLAYDIFGNYLRILQISMVFPVLGVISSLIATPPIKNEGI